MTTFQLLTIVGVPSVLSFLFQWVFKTLNDRHKKESEAEKWQRLGLQSLLRDRLLQEYKNIKEQGYCSVDEKTNYSNLYLCYENLGENGVMQTIYTEVIHMPNEKGESV